MQSNTKRKDAQDILKIIDELDKQGVLITAPSIAQKFGQTPANVHRILQMFNIDLKPYQRKYRAKVKQDRANNQVKDQAGTVAKLNALDTAKYTLTELVNQTAFQGTERQLKAIMVQHKLAYKTKSWFAQHLKKVETENKTLRELFNECKLHESDITFATFRTRLYENAIPYKQLITRKNWWTDLQGLDKQVPQEAIDELHAYFKEHQVNTPDYTIKELYGYFDFNMPYLAFKHLIISQNIQTNTIIIH